MKFIKRFFLIVTAVVVLTQTANAQLRKTATIENIGYFKGVLLSKVEISGDEIYRLHLPPDKSYSDPIVLILGTEDEMILNLKDLFMALSNAERGDIFDFESTGESYTLQFRNAGGSKWFDVYENNNNFVAGRLFDRTIKAILRYYNSLEE